MYSTHTNDENISSFFREGGVQNGDKSTSNGRDIDLFPHLWNEYLPSCKKPWKGSHCSSETNKAQEILILLKDSSERKPDKYSLAFLPLKMTLPFSFTFGSSTWAVFLMKYYINVEQKSHFNSKTVFIFFHLFYLIRGVPHLSHWISDFGLWQHQKLESILRAFSKITVVGL